MGGRRVRLFVGNPYTSLTHLHRTLHKISFDENKSICYKYLKLSCPTQNLVQQRVSYGRALNRSSDDDHLPATFRYHARARGEWAMPAVTLFSFMTFAKRCPDFRSGPKHRSKCSREAPRCGAKKQTKPQKILHSFCTGKKGCNFSY